MTHHFHVSLLCLVTLLVALSLPNSLAHVSSAVFLSPKFVLRPGSVEDKFYYNIDFPRGHIAIKGFTSEVVDEVGNPIPLHETYLHHWVVYRYYQEVNGTDHIKVRNFGLCDNGLWQYFGLGSETRRMAANVPDPYGVEVGNPAEIPPGYEEKWFLNVHATDTRGVEDRLGCTECRCDLYNVTTDENGEPLSPGYTGGLKCCYDQTWCRVDTSTGLTTKYHCLVEYDVESCSAAGVTNDGCINSKRESLALPTGGSVIYGVAHQHIGGIDSTLYGEETQDGRSYLLFNTNLWRRKRSRKRDWRGSRRHTGVMGLFYILVADESPKPNSFPHGPVEKHKEMTLPLLLWVVALFGVATAIAVVAYWKRREKKTGYQSITA
ncbi:hypothetical protein Vadar_028986 [Vaccinium darrowii]|uniref:Uncharacterized protein n=1 Tax=Vaccinium darrowii TaxID=229202 RepID=A0ACB7ZN88_9ERIC|nr:hypothetical protein Vadar_028986 [Vaccinium darrowii]